MLIFLKGYASQYRILVEETLIGLMVEGPATQSGEVSQY